MIPTSTALFLTIGQIMKKSGRLWIYPSQKGMLLILHKIYEINIADRTLRYHRLNFKNDGRIYCKRRWDRHADGTVFMKTTAMAITIYGYKDLFKMGHQWAGKYIKILIQKYGPLSDSAKKPLRENPEASNRAPLKKSGPGDPEDP